MTPLIPDITTTLNSLKLVLLNNSLVLLGGATGLWALTSLVLMIIPAHDRRAGFLARVLGLEGKDKQVIPLPPATSLWRDYLALEPEAVIATELPRGSPSLQGSYLVLQGSTASVICVHNFADVDARIDPEDHETEVLVFPVKERIRIQPAYAPARIAEDAAARTSIVERILTDRFGFSGKVQPIVLVKPTDGVVPSYDIAFTQSGVQVERLTFEDVAALRAMTTGPQKDPQQDLLARVRRFFLFSASRQTPRGRILLRTVLLALAAGFIALGYDGVTPRTLTAIMNGTLL